jgi:hypothetical protein
MSNDTLSSARNGPAPADPVAGYTLDTDWKEIAAINF